MEISLVIGFVQMVFSMLFLHSSILLLFNQNLLEIKIFSNQLSKSFVMMNPLGYIKTSPFSGVRLVHTMEQSNVFRGMIVAGLISEPSAEAQSP
jgi:hypothetical protein